MYKSRRSTPTFDDSAYSGRNRGAWCRREFQLGPFFPLSGDRRGKHCECWTMLGAWAEFTSRALIGPLVTCNTYRNPDLVADMARTVDHMSGGRLILGIGAGFKEAEPVEYGYEFGSAGARLADLGAALSRIRRRLAERHPAHKIPLLIGGGGERKTLRLVVQHADIWHTFTEGKAFAHKSRVSAGHCAAIGRDPAEIERSVPVGGNPPEVGTPLLALGATLFVTIVRDRITTWPNGASGLPGGTVFSRSAGPISAVE